MEGRGSWCSQCVCSSLSLSVSSAATFVVNVTQSSYEAEENHSITLEWTFTTRTQGSYRELFIVCSLLAPHKELDLYEVHEGVEIPESQDEHFSGRVQSDKDVLREGRIRLHVSRLRTEDSGLFVCYVKTEDGFNSGRCRLNVTARRSHSEPKTKPETTNETSLRKWGHVVALVVVIAVLSSCYLFYKKVKTGEHNPHVL
uniref:Immunoglobulin V-set domain-containing protein n=1 Tax=Poecilia formosa TaxID=48698 RepID=A0A087XLR3_POEFO